MSSGPDSAEHRADWYPDPTRRFEFRYHNGRDWTGDVSNDGRRFLDPLQRPAAGSPSEGARGAPGKGSGKATAALVLGIAAVGVGWAPFVFVLAAGAAVLAIVFAVLTLRRLRREQIVDPRARGFSIAGLVLGLLGLGVCVVGGWLTVLVYREVDEFVNVGQNRIRETSCVVDDGVATYDGTITNESPDTHDYHIEVVLQRPASDVDLYRGSVDVLGVEPGATEPWTVTGVVDVSEVECEVLAVSGPPPFGQS